MTAKTVLIEYALAHGWDDDDLAALENSLARPTDNALEESLGLFGERLCPPLEYCELVSLHSIGRGFGEPSSSDLHQLAPHEGIETLAGRFIASVASTG